MYSIEERARCGTDFKEKFQRAGPHQLARLHIDVAIAEAKGRLSPYQQRFLHVIDGIDAEERTSR